MTHFTDKEILEKIKHIKIESDDDEKDTSGMIEILFTLKSEFHHKTLVNQMRKSLKRVKRFLEEVEEIQSYTLTFELTKEGNIHYHTVCEITSYEELVKSEYKISTGFYFYKQLETEQHVQNAYNYLMKEGDNGYYAVQKQVFGSVIYKYPITKCSQLNKLIDKVHKLSVAGKPKNKKQKDSIRKYYNRSSSDE